MCVIIRQISSMYFRTIDLNFFSSVLCGNLCDEGYDNFMIKIFSVCYLLTLEHEFRFIMLIYEHLPVSDTFGLCIEAELFQNDSAKLFRVTLALFVRL